jgi:hypothetical protein
LSDNSHYSANLRPSSAITFPRYPLVDRVQSSGRADRPNGSDGWRSPGAIAACGPNDCWAFGDKITPVKWSFIAVDAEGNDHFAEALVEQEAVALYEPA